MSIPDPEKLIKACIKGDRLAQKAMYDHFKGKMYALCLRYATQQAEAEDMLLQGFFKVFRDLHQFTPGNSLEGWIRRVMVRTALMQLRSNKRWVSTLPETDWPGDNEPDAHLPPGTDTQHILRMMRQLPPGYRAVFNLYAIEGYSHREIAEQLDISESTSKSQYLRAKAALRKLLQDQKVS